MKVLKVPKKIIDKWKSLTFKQKRRIITLGTILVTLTFSNSSGIKDDIVSLYNASANAELFDESGNQINITSLENAKIFIDPNDYDSFGRVKAALVTNDDKISLGFVDPTKLSEKLDQIYLPKDTEILSTIYETNQGNIDSSSNWAWFRKDPVLDPNTKDARQVPPGEDFVGASYLTDDKNNGSLKWRHVLSINNDKIDNGYLREDVSNDINFDNIPGERFEVTGTDKAGGLALRGVTRDENGKLKASDEIILRIKDGSQVILLPNLSSYTEEENNSKIDWFYVAYKDENNNINYGFCAATLYTFNNDQEQVTHYLTNDSVKEEIYNNINIPYIVDTTSDKGIDLNMHKTAELKGDIVAKIPNGSTIYTSENFLNSTVNKDNHTWIMVRYADSSGNTYDGYISEKYLKKSDQVKESQTISLGNMGQLTGHFGIDLAPEFFGTSDNSLALFRQLLTSVDTYSFAHAGNTYNLTQTPDFVVLRLGHSSWTKQNGISTFYKTSSEKQIQKYIDICEELGVPYSFYYYGLSTNEDEANREIKEIVNTMNSLNLENSYMGNFYYDYENGSDNNINNYYKKYNKKTTDIINYEMNTLRSLLPNTEISLYTDNNTLNTLIDGDKLEDQNKANNWIVSVSRDHSNALSQNHSNYISSSTCYQIAIDTLKRGKEMDYDFMNDECYKRLTKNNSKQLN